MKTIALLISLFPFTMQAADPVVKLAGVQIVYDDGSKEFDGFKTYNSEKGLGVTLIVQSDDKQIVNFDDEKAAVKIGGLAARCRFFGGDMAFSKDHLALRLEFEAKGEGKISSDGTLKVDGVIPLAFATSKEETRSEAFSVAAGSAVKFPVEKAAALPTLKVKSSGKPKFGNEAFEIEFSTNRKTQEFAGIRFYTKDGKSVEAKQTSTSWMGFGSKGSGDVTFSFETVPTDLILAIETWTGREEVDVKVDLAAGLANAKH